MAVPKEAEFSPAEQEQIKQMIFTRLNSGRLFWRPLHARQDYWMMMYRLMDVVQAIKPVGQRRFVSNR